MAEEDELRRRRAEEYQMQLFGLHARTVCAAIKQKIEENVDSRCQKIYSSIEKKYNPDENGQITLKNNIKKLRKTYRHNMQPHLVAIENVVKKSINIPDNVLLSEDLAQATQYSDEEFHDLEMKLKKLQQQAESTNMFNAALKEELRTLEKLEESEAAAKQLCGIIDKSLSAKKLSSKTVQAIEKCKNLSESLNSLQPNTPKVIHNPRLDEDSLESLENLIDQ